MKEFGQNFHTAWSKISANIENIFKYMNSFFMQFMYRFIIKTRGLWAGKASQIMGARACAWVQLCVGSSCLSFTSPFGIALDLNLITGPGFWGGHF